MTGFEINNGSTDARLKDLQNPTSSIGLAAKNSAAEAMFFMEKVGEWSHKIAELKVFHDMAKKVNDA